VKGRFAAVFFIVGACAVVTGGLVAAITGPLALSSGSWVAAYLVLVVGVAQCAFGVAQAVLAPRPLSQTLFWVELGCWNVGSAAVIAGTLIAHPLVVDVGGVMLVITLALLLRTTFRSGSTRRWLLWAYRALIVVLLVSIPIGLTIAAVRA